MSRRFDVYTSTTHRRPKMVPYILVFLLLQNLGAPSDGFCLPQNKVQTDCEIALWGSPKDKPDRKSAVLDFLINPYNSKIPKKIRAEVYRVEASTEAAKGRDVRLAKYLAIALTGFLLAFFNAFLTGLREDVDSALVDGTAGSLLKQTGLDWVEDSNFLIRFLFLNKIGGLLLVLTGGAGAILAEYEFDTRRMNAEKIFQQMKKRRKARIESSMPEEAKKSRRLGIKKKRMMALAETMHDEPTHPPSVEETIGQVEATAKGQDEEPETVNDMGLVTAVKSICDRTGSMFLRALLLNKINAEERTNTS